MIDSRRSDKLKVFLGVTGASGSIIALRLAEVMRNSIGVYMVTVVSKNALLVADKECISSSWFMDRLKRYSDEVYDEEALDAPISSSSNTLDIYIIVPASIKTMSMIVNGIASNLLIRAVLNGLRMKRTVIAVIRESPLGEVELEILYKASRMGIVVVPAVVGFYTYPQNIGEVVDFIVGKVLDILRIDHNLYRRWRSNRDTNIKDPCQILYDSKES